MRLSLSPRIAASLAIALLVASALWAQSPAELRRHFADPPAEFRPMPLWVWHDEMQWNRLQEQLRQFKQQGIGGVFVHPRPGLMTEYLGAEWFRLWRLSVEEGKRLGLYVNIYDENSYPAGFAGGHVVSRAPDTAIQAVAPELDAIPARIPWRHARTVAVFAVRKDPSGAILASRRIQSAAELAPSESAVVFRLRTAQPDLWTAGFPYVDLTHPDTGRTFLSTTFEAYKKEVGADFGGTIRWVFDDEPELSIGGGYGPSGALPLNFITLAEFRKRCGYDLADRLPSLFWDTGDWRQVRYDYWQTLHDLWKENYFAPIHDWCDRHHLQFTGHWMEHEWPYPWVSPDDASFYAFEHMPGIDMLTGIQATALRTGGSDPHMLFTVRQMSSVAQQLGRRAFSESYGVSGFDATLEHFKLMGDWLMVNGVNFVNLCQSWGTTRGARKRDYPPTFTDASAWWPYYRVHADHLSRVSYMLSRGAPRNRVLVLEPTTSGFLWARRDGPTPELARLRATFCDLVQSLADHQVDFNLADEYILEWFGKQDGRRLRVGQVSYDVLVWPEGMVNLRRQTLPLVEQFLAAGGQVLALSDPAPFLDGRPSGELRQLRERYRAQWHRVAGTAELLAEIAARMAPRIRFDAPVPPGVGLAERFLENGERILFLTNSGKAPIRMRAAVEGGALERWDTVHGGASLMAFHPAGPHQIGFDLDLPRAGSELLLVKAAGPSPAVARPRWEPLRAAPLSIRADAPNVLTLDYCDFKTRDAELKDANTWRANWLLWRTHGFERPMWDSAVQFRTRVFDRNHFDAASGFDATFRFEAGDAAALAGLEVALESPELYRVTVNGRPVDVAAGQRWFDPHVKRAPIAALAHTGINTITVSGHPFDVRMELENIYLRGNFRAVPVERGFRLTAPASLSSGSWAKQGYPFYSDAVLYQFHVDAPPGATMLQVAVEEWAGSLAEILLDSKRVALIAWQPYLAEFPATAGAHTIGVRIVSTPRNLFGPYHNPAHPRMEATPHTWDNPPAAQPPGAKYEVLDYGLLGAIQVKASVP